MRFELQEGAIVLPKSTNISRIQSNLNLFDFELTTEEMQGIRALDTKKGSHDPDAPGVAQALLNAFKIED